MKKVIFIFLLTFIFCSYSYFNASIVLTITPDNAKVFVENDILPKPPSRDDKVHILLGVAKIVHIRIEIEGYKTKRYNFIYGNPEKTPDENRYGDTTFYYGRGKTEFPVEMEKIN